jgi:hypothetical protein
MRRRAGVSIGSSSTGSPDDQGIAFALVEGHRNASRSLPFSADGAVFVRSKIEITRVSWTQSSP